MNKLKNTVIALASLGLAVMPVVASAATGNPTGGLSQIKQDLKTARVDARQEFVNQVKENKGEFSNLTPEERKAKIAEMKTNINAKLLDRLDVFVGKAIDIFGNAVSRMNNFADRVDAMIKKLGDKHPDLDLTDAKALLADAKLKIADVTNSLPTLDSDADAAILGSQNAKEAFDKIKDLIKTFRDTKIKVAHDALVQSVEAVKAGIEE